MTAHQDDMHDAALHFNRPSHPTFARGHCFMVETLNRREVEAVGPIVAAEVVRLEAEGEDARHLRRALGKMDYPEPAEGFAADSHGRWVARLFTSDGRMIGEAFAPSFNAACAELDRMQRKQPPHLETREFIAPA